MVHKVNTKARIERHLRIYKESGTQKLNKSKKSNMHINALFFFVIVLFPTYPTLASFVHGNTQYEFYRGDIDVDSILGSYDGEIDDSSISDAIIEGDDSFISINTILNSDRDLSGTNEVVEHTVQAGESFSIISDAYEITANTILWENNFKKNHVLQPGDIIKIPPVSGLRYEIKKGDSIKSLAKKYEITEEEILAQNQMSINDSLLVGNKIMLPGAKKIIPKPVYRKPPPRRSFASASTSKYTNQKGSYQLVKRSPYSGVPGNCTWYVASHKNVKWRGNANQWLPNARAAGYKTGSTPTLGSVVSLAGRGYNRRYGHVAIVMEVQKDHIIVSDMNYRKLYEVTYRKISLNDRAIQGYIYVD
ncbi:MAG: LysM peptidoglycan-binding domain-containing protein [Candidatus Gracilibacteria bacterium]|nr:LysM peptidoglycan-binding domain-containing protein [Candidatus Gracilibacteria bacterium]